MILLRRVFSTFEKIGRRSTSGRSTCQLHGELAKAYCAIHHSWKMLFHSSSGFRSQSNWANAFTGNGCLEDGEKLAQRTEESTICSDKQPLSLQPLVAGNSCSRGRRAQKTAKCAKTICKKGCRKMYKILGLCDENCASRI